MPIDEQRRFRNVQTMGEALDILMDKNSLKDILESLRDRADYAAKSQEVPPYSAPPEILATISEQESRKWAKAVRVLQQAIDNMPTDI